MHTADDRVATHHGQAETLRQDRNTATSCAKGTYGPGQLQGRVGMGPRKPWEEQANPPVEGHFSRSQCMENECGQRGYAASNTASAWSDPQHPEEVMPENGTCYRTFQARDTLAFKQQMLNVAPPLFPSRLSPRSRTRIWTISTVQWSEDVIKADPFFGRSRV